MSFDSVVLALTAFEVHRTPNAITKALAAGGREALKEELGVLDAEARDRLEDEAQRLSDRGVGALLYGDAEFPASLVRGSRPVAPVLFYLGVPELMHAPSVGMCGSRHVTELGLKAASSCGDEVSRRGLAIVSGYAKGVDTATHLSALRNEGSTIIVLAEGIDHFRVKRDFVEDFAPDRVLVVSQFPPSQPWRAFAAMARNAIISGLGRALIVIEAGEKGGTRAAGEGALEAGKPLLVLDFGGETPAGNRHLISLGGTPIDSRSALGLALDGLAQQDPTAKHEDVLF